MPALNFKNEFTSQIKAQQKRQTIRKVRKNPIKIGDTLYLKTGMRTKKCCHLGTAECKNIQEIEIYSTPMMMVTKISIDGKVLSVFASAKLAKADGFADTKDFIDFFKNQYGLPFSGVVIYW